MPDKDETVAPSATEETATATEQTTEVEATPPAEAIKTETTAESEPSEEEHPDLSYKRFVEINAQRKKANDRADRFEKELKLAKESASAEPPTAVELTEPPEHLSQREKVDFYVRQGAERLMQEKLGMNLDQVKTLLQTIPGVSDATYEQQWQRMCEAKGLDPNDRTIQDLTRGLVKGSGHDVQDALSVVANLIGKKKAATSETTPQIMENGATAHTMTKENVDFVWDKGAAMTLASQGRRVDNASAVDILKAAEKISKAKAAEK